MCSERSAGGITFFWIFFYFGIWRHSIAKITSCCFICKSSLPPSLTTVDEREGGWSAWISAGMDDDRGTGGFSRSATAERPFPCSRTAASGQSRAGPASRVFPRSLSGESDLPHSSTVEGEWGRLDLQIKRDENHFYNWVVSEAKIIKKSIFLVRSERSASGTHNKSGPYICILGPLPNRVVLY